MPVVIPLALGIRPRVYRECEAAMEQRDVTGPILDTLLPSE
jgi:hypothetical protein